MSLRFQFLFKKLLNQTFVFTSHVYMTVCSIYSQTISFQIVRNDLHAGKHLILHMRARLRPRQHPRHCSWVSGRSEISLSQPPHNRALEGGTRRLAVLIPSVIWVSVTSTFGRSRAPAPCILSSLLILLHDLHIGAMKHPHRLIHTCPPTSARCGQSLNEQSPRRRPVASSACRSQEEP